MSIIRIKRRADPIVRPYEIAKKIKQRWTGDADAGVKKAEKDTILDLGDEFCGTYGQIDTIELNDKPRAPQPLELPEKPLTPEEEKERLAKLEEIRASIQGILGPKKVKGKMQFTRSGLNEYKRLTGHDYQLPEGTEIVEDL